MISKNERILLVCAKKSKKYIFSTSKDRYAHVEENFDVKQIVAVKSRNHVIFDDEDESIHDSLSLLGTIRLSPRLSGFLSSNYNRWMCIVPLSIGNKMRKMKKYVLPV